MSKAGELAKLIASEVKAIVSEAGRDVLPMEAVEATLAPFEQNLSDALTRMIEAYGRLVQEAAAKEANRVAGPGVVSPFSPADAIREMPLP